MVSKKFQKLTGYEEQEITGKSIFDFPIIAGKDKKELVEKLEKRMAGQEIEVYIIEVAVKSGQKLFAEINGSYIKYQGQDAVMLVLRDVTSRKETEDRLQKAYQELERVNTHLVGRELQMAELKKRIKELESKK